MGGILPPKLPFGVIQSNPPPPKQMKATTEHIKRISETIYRIFYFLAFVGCILVAIGVAGYANIIFAYELVLPDWVVSGLIVFNTACIFLILAFQFHIMEKTT